MDWFSKGYRETLESLTRKRRRDFFTSLFFGVLIPLLAVTTIVFVCRSQRRTMIGELQELQLEKLQLEAARDELSQAIAVLSSRKRIFHLATEDLGMKYPEHGEVVLVMVGDSGEADGIEGEDRAEPPVAFDRRGRQEQSTIGVLTHFFAMYVF